MCVNMLPQLGCGGSVVKELRLLKKQASKPSSSNILAKNRSILSSDIDKVQRWAEHFAEVSNCCSSSCQLDTDARPDIIAATPSDKELFPDDENLSQPISEDEIQVAIAQLRDGKAPEDDGISAEVGRRRNHLLAHFTVQLHIEQREYPLRLVEPPHCPSSQEGKSF